VPAFGLLAAGELAASWRRAGQSGLDERKSGLSLGRPFWAGENVSQSQCMEGQLPGELRVWHLTDWRADGHHLGGSLDSGSSGSVAQRLTGSLAQCWWRRKTNGRANKAAKKKLFQMGKVANTKLRGAN